MIDIDTLIQAIYAAAVSPELWPAVLQDICTALGCVDVGLFTTDVTTGAALQMQTTGLLDQVATEYAEHSLAIDPLVQFGRENRWLEFSLDEMDISGSDMDRSEYYGWIAVAGLRYYFAARWMPTARTNAYAAFKRSPSQGPVDMETLSLFKRLLPHLRRGVEVTRRLEQAGLDAAASGDMADRLPYGVVLLDRNGAALFRNRAAEAITGANDGITCDGTGLSVSYRLGAFRELVTAAVKSGAGGRFVAARPSGRQGYRIVVAPMPRPTPLFATRYPAAVVFIVDPEATETPPLEALRQWFGLTRREAALAQMLAGGSTLAEAAERLRIRRTTARNYLQSIFRKTGAGSQSDLIRLLGALPDRMGR